MGNKEKDFKTWREEKVVLLGNLIDRGECDSYMLNLCLTNAYIYGQADTLKKEIERREKERREIEKEIENDNSNRT